MVSCFVVLDGVDVRVWTFRFVVGLDVWWSFCWGACDLVVEFGWFVVIRVTG